MIRARELGWDDQRLLDALERRAEQAYSRRAILKLGAGALLPLAALSAGELRAAERRKKTPQNAEPLVIVGAGVAGLVAAYRLQSAGVPVVLYDGASRIGGRVFTHDRFNAQGMFCELGGELIDTDHKDVRALCKELGLEIQDLRPFDVGVEPDLFHFGGRVYTQKELLPAFKPLASALARDIHAIFPDGDARMPTFDNPGVRPEITRKFDRMSLKDYLRARTDVDPWVLDAIEVLYVCEYGMDAAEQSALNLLILIQPEQKPGELNLLGDSDECARVKGGNSRLVEALENRVRAHAPRIHLKHKLTRIEDRAGKILLTFEAEGGSKTVSAARAVLGMPFSTLRGVEGVSRLHLSALKKKCIAELGYGINTKFMLGFTERLWRRSAQATPPSRANILTDALDQSFWETSKGQDGSAGILTNYLGGSRTRDGRAASDRLPTALAELDRLYPGLQSKHDGNVALFQWGSYKLSLGSYVSPKIGQYTSLWGSASAPELGGRLFFTGEHTSVEGAGFINGAVQSGNQVAEQILRKKI
jgi:monoamine oxidase